MTMGEETVVGTCHELAAGDFIVARYKGALVHRGRVTERVPEHGLFWILDELAGGRRLLDMADLEIGRVRSDVTAQDPGAEPAAA
ncbi:hypothetical protein [Arthrobacter sp. Y81]|uniref:hypothetical protein n=1 Tax=Arthrobacter sp. Y81 TaxID=2058897 RepID=UPI0021588AF4|nr:hypothetical protein [Arthrobacter sp. Y81]